MEEVKGEDGPNEIDWEAYLNSYQFNEPSTASNKGNVASDDLPSFEANLVDKEDLPAHLAAQLALLKLNEAEKRIAHSILFNLDDDGYLRLPDVEGDPLIRMASEADVDVCLAERTLRKIQHLDPKGCGARDLQECLLIQVAGLNDPRAALLGTMVKRHMKALESKNYPAIARDLKVSLDEVIEASRLLAKLDPKPGRNFTAEDAHYITPDVFIYKMGDGYTVVLNDDGLSKLRISGAYRQALRKGVMEPGKAKEFIQDKLRSAMWLIRSIHQRQRTIYKVTESIVKFQRDFLDKGIAHLKPLILRDVAEDIGMHESTVSRVTTNKYVHTPQGIYELKYFFNSSIARVAGEDIAVGGRQESHQADCRRGGQQQPLLRPEDRGAAPRPRHRHRPPHGGQVPRGAGRAALQQAQELLLKAGPDPEKGGPGRWTPWRRELPRPTQSASFRPPASARGGASRWSRWAQARRRCGFPTGWNWSARGACLQGAAVMALSDTAFWLALMTLVGEELMAVTLEMKTNFLKGAKGALRCEARVLQSGRRVVYGEASCFDASGRRVSHHTLTYLLP